MNISNESQKHGFIFEDIVLQYLVSDELVLDCIEKWRSGGNYTAKWDIPSYDEISLLDVCSFGRRYYYNSFKDNIHPPISIKMFKNGGNPEFGDINRTIDNFSLTNNENFFVIIGFWEQVNKLEKEIKDILIMEVNDKNEMVCNFRKMNIEILEKLNPMVRSVKNIPAGRVDSVIRKDWSHKFKEVFNNYSFFSPRVKIDSKKQRRIQCAITLDSLKTCQTEKDKHTSKLFLEYLGKNSIKIESKSRKRHKKKCRTKDERMEKQ